MNNTQKGNLGENIAGTFLEKKGYAILERNYRYKHYEIDLIAEKDGILVFVEVKTRKNSIKGNPEEWVNKFKEDRIMLTADFYIHEIDWKKDIRFDVIAIIKNATKEEIHHIEDAFH
jgi:putative endonuclease